MTRKSLLPTLLVLLLAAVSRQLHAQDVSLWIEGEIEVQVLDEVILPDYIYGTEPWVLWTNMTGEGTLTGIGRVTPYHGPAFNYEGWYWRFYDNNTVYGRAYLKTPVNVMVLTCYGNRRSENEYHGICYLGDDPNYEGNVIEGRVHGTVYFRLTDNLDGSYSLYLSGPVPLGIPTP